MSEISTASPEITRTETPTPLSPKSYENYSVQRKIIGFHATSGDTIVFKQNDFDATQAEESAFSKDLINGKFNADELSEMLRFLPDGLSGEDKLVKYSDLGLRLSQDEVMKQVMGHLVGIDRLDDLDPAHVARFLHKYPTPVELGNKVDKFLDSVEKGSDHQTRIGYEKITRELLEGLYGQRLIYYQNFKLMLEKAQEGKSKKKPLKLSKPSRVRKTAGLIPATIFGLTAAWGGISMANDLAKDGRIDGPLELSEAYISRQETESENKIEDKFGIEILDIREAYKLLGKHFNVYDENELGRHPPTRWSDEQIKLLGELLPRLPENFYNPHGEKLSFALTDYGENCPCAGTFHENHPNLRSALLLLSDGNFNPNQKGDWPFRLLTHELAHRVDIDLLEEKLHPEVIKILGFNSFSEARDNYLPKLEEVTNNIQGLDSISFRLNYGFMGIENKGLNQPTEFVAVLAETYVGGRVEFMKIGEFIGMDKADKLYDLIKNKMFNGKEYGLGSGDELKDRIAAKGVELLESDDHKWSKTELEILYKSLNILPTATYHSTNIDENSEQVKVKIEIGDKLEIVGEDKIILPKSIFTNRLNAFTNIGGLLVESRIDTAGSREWIENEFEINSEPNAREILNDLIKLYLKGEYFFTVDAGKINSKFDIRKNEESNERNHKAYEFIKDKIFQGREYTTDYVKQDDFDLVTNN